MKKVLLIAALFSGVTAQAAPVGDFESDEYNTCDAHSAGDIVMAKDAARAHVPVEDVVNRHFGEHAPIMDLTLSLLAENMIKAGYLKSAGEQKLQGFLTGVCYYTAH
ncbi:hypothetical protein [Paraburkholderia acidisoli]|uniref:Uncharacterized protein n=1 Tax=Paraburkholderia acidisoli TaxID=2571748 RepID=A0A7Z2GQM8_9BURK|nr:hypothetical protein [Paraburkholderia acidisoli]QGZ65950.1 hypothetical protein FAZ98_29440 [Paraburkholderia acidisoli]